MKDALDTARAAILAERDGLGALADALDRRFVHAIETLEKALKTGGRVIITGMGKSGHIARKIAATMASTGSPAQYVHPAEASHGDLGMITERDAVIAISNSGEAPELSDIIAYTRRFGIPLIGISAKPASTLAQHSDVVLALPDMPEACPNGLAPTTSTTTAMALGDALAVTLFERRGLTPEQYRVFHPGGKLGQRLKKVSDLMDPLADLPVIAAATTMDRALLVMTEKNLGCVIVEDEKGTVAGIITDGDLKRHMSPTLLTQTAGAVMTANPKSIAPDALAAEAVDMMLRTFKTPITSLLVMKDGRLAGLIRLQTCLQAGVL
ncbi:MAG: KpsF/GutQ family sugar-phosphate isomerase [Rhodospirillales bacterium]|nr:KpsF/GutQ family sugar-phosphate isomerase [Alphaproteobacteria bacterium]MCB9986903.1 KpsF/GutQ family sugar-phosphate isomerase [Rhodospirillales bacterium]USO08319.1 MAG: KpsF/GutQ family sugar-phosphate isomerase [Rhodospirillales bacterium]